MNIKNIALQNQQNLSFGYSFFLKDVTLPCAYCGGKMLSNRNVSRMAKMLEERTGNDAISILHNHYRHLDKKQQVLVDILSQEIKKAPQSPVKVIVETLAQRFENTTNIQYSDAITNAFKNSEIEINSPLGENLQKIIENSQKSLLANVINSKQKTLRITDLRKDLISMINSSCNDKEKLQLRKFMQSVDTDFDYIKQDPHSFFTKFGYEPMKSFLGSLFAPIRSTTDHVVTVSRNGASESANYIAVCGMCNWKRSEEPLKNFLKHNPQIIRNIKKQFALIDELLSPKSSRKQHSSIGFLDNVVNYLQTIQKTLQDEFGKPIDLCLPFLNGKLK